MAVVIENKLLHPPGISREIFPSPLTPSTPSRDRYKRQKLKRHSLTRKQSGCLHRSVTEQNCRTAEESCSLRGLAWLVAGALGVRGMPSTQWKGHQELRLLERYGPTRGT